MTSLDVNEPQRRDCQCKRARHRHGTRQSYAVDRCRCFTCRLGHARRKANWLAGRATPPEQLIDAASTQLRLKALAAIGISRHTIAADLGVSVREVQYLRNTRTVVQVGTALRVAELYERRWDERPTGRSASLARAQAKRQGWLPPMALDEEELQIVNKKITRIIAEPPFEPSFSDEIAVQEAVTGRPVGLTRRELAEAIATLDRMGFSARQIAERLRITERAVTRHRAKGRAA